MTPLKRLSWIGLVLVAVLAASGAIGNPAYAAKVAKPKEKETPPPRPEEMPWSLRDHYTFEFEKAIFTYAVDNAQWELDVKGLGVTLQRVGASITLADGTVLNVADFGTGESERKKVETLLGEGTEYRTFFAEKNGIAPVHIVVNHKTKPFFTVAVELTNKGAAPIEVAKISPVILGPGNLSNLSTDTVVRMSSVGMRGPCPVMDKTGGSLSVMFNDEAHDLTLLFGVIPGQVASSSVRFGENAGAWQGEAQCVFNPPVKLAPGETMRSDPIWVSFSIPEPSDVDAVYAWAHSTSNPDDKAVFPDGWVTVDDEASSSSLAEAAKVWTAAGVKYALVPGSWESQPGSWEGAGPRYSKDMGKVAQALRGAGAKPGLTVDPLGAEDANPAWTVRTEDGGRWLNPTVAEAREYAVKQASVAAAKWGFEFFAVKPSAMPDAVLKHFNMTRAQADYWAFDIMRAAAAGKPVFPTSACAMGAELDAWLEAAGATSRLEQYRVAMGPVRCEATGGSLADDVVTAMSFCGAPIEFRVSGNSKPPSWVGRAVAKLPFAAHPFDAEQTTPKLWCLKSLQSGEEDLAAGIVAFPGALPWDPAEMDESVSFGVWRKEGDSFREVTERPVPAPTAFTLYNVAPKSSQPVVMAASSGEQLSIFDVTDAAWNEAELTFSGSLTGTKGGTAYVYVPAGLKLRSATAGRDTVRKADANGLVPLASGAGQRTPFKLVFQR